MTEPRSIRAAIEARRRLGGRALVPFLTAGYPDWELMDRAVRALAAAGADLLELGIPFSDPLADGPVIQASSQRALAAGVTVERIFEELGRRAPSWNLPVVLMTYVNPVLAFGPERFAARAREAGVGGVLVSDLPPEELPEVWDAFRAGGLQRVVLVAPTTAEERIPLLAAAADGFIYCVTRTGVTGKGGAYATNLAAQVERVRRETQVPVLAGFGIRAPEDAATLKDLVDGVVVGARWIELLAEDRPDEERLDAIRALAGGLRRTLDGEA